MTAKADIYPDYVLDFGEYAGKRMTEIPSGELIFIIDLSADSLARDMAKAEYKRRCMLKCHFWV